MEPLFIVEQPVLTNQNVHLFLGDSLAYHHGMNFSTKDRDNDPSSDKCAVDFLGAWWYNDCQRSNLNGQYLSFGSHTSSDHGIEWFTFTGPAYSLKSSKMMIRK